MSRSYGEPPVMLDLFCGAGGVAKGYADAGFRVVGCDIKPQPLYPFEFHHIGALDLLGDLLRGYAVCGFLLSDLAAIHASPPCPRFSALSNSQPGTKEKYPDLVTPIRPMLQATNLPYVIENVVGAPLLDPVMLCGTSFGLRIRHHRLFETNFPVEPLACDHQGYVINLHNTKSRARLRLEYPGQVQMHVWAREKGVPWIQSSWKELKDAIPPVMTHYIGAQLLRQSELEAAA